MKVPYYHCWYCGEELSSNIILSETEHFLLSCKNHGNYFVNYYIIEDIVRSELKFVSIYKNNEKEFVIFYPNGLYTWFTNMSEKGIKLNPSVWMTESDPSKIYEKAYKIKNLVIWM